MSYRSSLMFGRKAGAYLSGAPFRDKHLSLLRTFVNHGPKSLYNIVPDSKEREMTNALAYFSDEVKKSF
jgi:hypothetical protein